MKPPLTRAFLPILALVACLGAPGVAHASASHPVTVVVLDGVSLPELQRGAPAFTRIASQGAAVGLMTRIRPEDPLGLSGYFGLSTGLTVVKIPEDFSGLGLHESTERIGPGTARQAWESRTGTSAGEAGGVVPDMVSFASRTFGTAEGLGSLGHAVRSAGLTTAYVQGGDTGVDPDRHLRPGGFIAADTMGLADFAGTTDLALTADPGFPMGVRDDYAGLQALALSAQARANLTVVALNDLRRAQADASRSTTSAASEQRVRIVSAADEMLAAIARSADANRMVVFVSLTPPREAQRTDAVLMPVLIFGGETEPGVLAMSSTRREALVTVSDLHDTVLGALGLSGGRPSPVKTTASSDSVSEASAIERGLLASHESRTPLLSVYLGLQAALLFALALPLWKGDWRGWPALRRAAFLLPLLTGPLLLVVAGMPGNNPLLVGAVWGVTCIAVALALATVREWRLPVLLASAGTAAIVLGDLVAGGHLQSRSALGYDPMVGGRFYGIGNEYMGVAIGGAVLAAAITVDHLGARRFRWPAAGLLLVIAALFALPSVGADAGGAVTAFSAAGVFGWALAERRPSTLRSLLAAFGFIVAATVAVLTANVIGAFPQSHVSRFIARAGAGDISYLVSVVARKFSANLVVASTWPWEPVLLVAVVSIVVAALSRRRALRAGHAIAQGSMAGICALAVALIVGFSFNDSGATSVVTMSAYLLALLVATSQPAQPEPAPADDADEAAGAPE